ncbi:MAG: hypothetical protein KGK30_03335, partial [Elusimicrobia bacterium]|nr:hypothetical protein [Elusimicrobiota bacterium]
RMPSGEWRGTIAGDDELSGVADISGATESSVPVSVQVHMAGDTLGQQAWISGDFTVSVEVEVEREAGKPATPPHDGAQPDPPAPKRLYCVLRIEQEAKCVYQCENSDYKVLDKLAGESCKKELYFESAP